MKTASTLLVYCALLGYAGSSPTCAANGQPPNIVLIMCDDMGFSDLGCYKQLTHMGGISSPLIVHFPKRFSSEQGQIRNGLAHITDILPTCLELADVAYPDAFKGKPLAAPDGLSLVPAIHDDKLPERDFYFEHQTSCAVISGDWKLVRAHLSKPWELIDLKNDPFEQNDAAQDYPDKVKALESKWNTWAHANRVFPLETRSWTPRFKHYQNLYPDQDGLD